MIYYGLKIQKSPSLSLLLNTAEVWPFTMRDSANEGTELNIPAIMLCRKDYGEKLYEMLRKKEKEEEKWCVTMGTDGTTKSCAVCQSEFGHGDDILRMPCKKF